MSMDDLPMELCEEILRVIRENKDVKALSRVSSKWSLPSRHRLFSSMTVLDDAKDRDFRAFSDLLASAPQLCAVIRRLTLQGSRAFTYRTQMTVEYLEQLLSYLPGLGYLTIQSTSFVPALFLDDRHRGAYRLTCLRLERVGTSLDSAMDFVAALSIFSHIGRLAIFALTPFRDTGWILQNDPNRFAAMLEHLTVSELQACSEDVYDIFLSTSVPSRIKRFGLLGPFSQHVFGVPNVPPSASQLLLRASSTLDHIDLKIYQVDRADSEHYQRAWDDFASVFRATFHELPSLRSFSVILQVTGSLNELGVSEFWTAFLVLVAILPARIRQIEFTLWERADPWRLPREDSFSWASAGVDLRALQTELSRFGQLESVGLRSWDYMLDKEKEAIARGMPDMARAGLISYAAAAEPTRSSAST